MPTVAASFSRALLENQVTSASFRIPVAVTVPSDNSPQKVPITTITLAAKPEYLAIPKHVLAAFLTDKVTNTSDFPLIAGPMNVFLDGTLVASSRIATVMPGEKFNLALGADEGISLKRKLNSRFTEDAGIVSKKTRITYDFTLTVQNNKRAAVTVSPRPGARLAQREDRRRRLRAGGGRGQEGGGRHRKVDAGPPAGGEEGAASKVQRRVPERHPGHGP